MTSRRPFGPMAGAAKSCLQRSSRAAGSSPTTSAARTSTSTTSQHTHAFTTQSVSNPSPEPGPFDVPRWKQAPKAMTAPVRARPINPHNVWRVNEDPRKVDEAYRNLLGRNGHKMLPEDVMWMALTHKSFDHGRRGFNDRLAFYGKRIVELQTTLALLGTAAETKVTPDQYGRMPFMPPVLAGLEHVLAKRNDISGKKRLAKVAAQCGFDRVIRWKPKQANDLRGSGLEGILTHTMYAIVGAIALQRGGAVANELVREKLMVRLSPYGQGTSEERLEEMSS